MSNDTGRVLFVGDYVNPDQQWWLSASNTATSAADLQVSTLTVNPYTAGNILLQSCNTLGTIYNAPLIFQRPATGGLAPLGPTESLVMNLSLGVPTYPINSYFISATKFGGTAYDDIAVKGIQIFGDQTTSANAGAAGYITAGPNLSTISIDTAGLYVSSIFVSTLNAGTVVSTTTGVANSYTASVFMSTPILFADTLKITSNISTGSLVSLGNISTSSLLTGSLSNSGSLYTKDFFMPNVAGLFTVQPSATFNGNINAYNGIGVFGTAGFNGEARFGSTVTMSAGQVLRGYKISTFDLTATTATISSLNVSTFQGQNVNISTMNVSSLGVGEVTTKAFSSIIGSITLNLVSTLQLSASISPNINLGLGNVIQGLIGGAATQALGVTVGTIGLATGSMALITGRSSGGVNPSVFQTINGSTQLQFSTIGINTQSVFLDTDSLDPLHTPGDLTRKTINFPANTYCVRSVSDPLNVDSSSLAIQMFGQWVPVLQNNPGFLAASISSFTVSSINGFQPGNIIPSTIFLSSIYMGGNLSNENANAAISWVGSATISSINVSSINGAQPGGTFVPPNNFFLSTITMSGNLIATNPNSAVSGFSFATLSNITTTAVNLKNSLGNTVGTIAGSTTLGQGFQLLASGGLTISRDLGTPPQFVFNTNQTININSTMTVSTLIAPVATISTLTVSTLIGSGSSFQIPSTINLSTVNVNGNLSMTNINSFLSTVNVKAVSMTSSSNAATYFNCLNTNGQLTGTITGGNPDLSLNGINIQTPTTLYVSAGPNNTQPIFKALYGSTYAQLLMAPGNSIIQSQEITATSNILVAPSAFRVIELKAVNATDGIIQSYGGLTISTNTQNSGAPNAGPFTVNATQIINTASGVINLSSGTAINISSTTVNITPSVNVSSIITSSINGVVFPPPATFTMPVGSVIVWSGLPGAIPAGGWLICDGSAVAIATYSALYSIIGLRYVSIYQAAPPAGSFYLPDLTYSVPMGGSQIGYAPIIYFRTGPDINSYCAPGVNKLWEVQAVARGHLNLNTRFRLVGVTGDIFIAKFINWNPSTNSGFLLVICNDTTLPRVGPTFFPLTSPGGTAGDTYTSGKYGGTGVPNTVKTLELEELAPHTHGGSPGTYTTGAGASPPQAGTNGPAVNYDGTNTIDGVGVVNNSFVMAPSYISMYYIIKT